MKLKPSDWTIDYFLSNEEECSKILEDASVFKEIPSLNNTVWDHLKNGQLVRFSGMVQDMYNPEIYLKTYQVSNKQTGVLSKRCGKYVDIVQCESYERISFDSEENENGQRQVLVVISTPGLNNWAEEKHSKATYPADCSSSSIKRTFDDSEEIMDCTGPSTKKEKFKNENQSESVQSTSKNPEPKQILSKEHFLNFPIPNIDGKSCIVKVYNEDSCTLNKVVNIIGFLSVHPVLSKAGESDEMEIDQLEKQTYNPPASIVPRLHAIKVFKEIKNPIFNNPNFITKAESIRGDLKMMLSQLLFGDKLAADYLICNLISSVYLRQEGLCLGSFPLNISNFPIKDYPSYPKDFYDILSQILPKTHYIKITLENLNDLSFVPKKDYECNRLTSGILQLSDSTHLVIDESGLTPGQISAAGRQNYQALSDVLRYQKVAYDFNFYTVDYETDLPILIFSEVKSFIPCDMRIVLKPDEESLKLYPQVNEAANQYLKDQDRLNNFREYLHVIKEIKFEIQNEMTDVIQDDFVKIRQINSSFSGDNLHYLMVLARLMAISYGLNTLTTEIWKKSVEMELERINRLPKARS